MSSWMYERELEDIFSEYKIIIWYKFKQFSQIKLILEIFGVKVRHFKYLLLINASML